MNNYYYLYNRNKFQSNRIAPVPIVASIRIFRPVTTIDRMQVNDMGLSHLRGLPKLQSLDLRETQVTDDGVKALRQVLPRLQVRR